MIGRIIESPIKTPKPEIHTEEGKDALELASVVFLATNASDARVTVNQGGTWSGKTYSILQVLYLKAMYEDNVVITVIAEDVPALKKGAYRDALSIRNNSPKIQSQIKFWNKSDRVVYFSNGSMIEFISVDSVDDAKHGKRDYLFINEATGLPYEYYWQLAIRTRKQIYLDYNPSAPFWVHDNVIGQPDVKLIISDHRHNPFLTDLQHREIEGIKDPELWLVYARGKTGNLSGLIFPHFIKIPDSDYPWNEEKFFGGLDFGYTNDPTAGVRIVRKDNTVWLHEMFYEPGMPALTIKQNLYSFGFGANKRIYCEHDPDMIADLRRLKVLAISARKGKGSVNAGILLFKSLTVFYTASSKNLHEEKKRYMWEKDPITGKSINEPKDEWNHLMDASRYGVYTNNYTKR